MKKILSLLFAVPAVVSAEGMDTNWPNLEEVIIATKCHLDVGYTATVPELMRKYSTTDLDNAFTLFDSDKDKPADLRARWTVPAWAMDVMLEKASPGRRSRLEEAIRQRRLMWHAYPFTIETEASDLEELVRMFAFSSGISRRFGFDLPRYVKQTDVPDQAWALPTVLAHAGVKFLHMGINPGCKQKEFLDKLPVLSWWEGPDGSRVLLGFSSGYGWMGWGSLTPPKGWRHKTWLAYMMRSDNKGPISPKDAEKILERAKAELPGVKVRYGDPAEFADAILAEERANPTLPVVRGDMPDTWIHGQMTAPEATLLHRHAKSDLITLGILDTSLRAFGVKTDPVAGELEQGYRQSCLYSEHTWGFSCYRDRKRFQDPDWRERYDRGEFKHIDDSFDYHMKYARRAYAIAQDGIKKRMEALARSVDVEGPRVVVFNPLPYARDAVVEVEIPEGYSLPGGVRDGGKVKFLAKGLPPGGYKTFNVVHEEQVKHEENQNDLHVLHGQKILHCQTKKLRTFTVKFDLEKGGIASLVENATGRELVKQGGHALGQFLHERFSQNEVLRFVGAYNRAHQRNINSDFGKAGLPPPDKVPYTALTPKNWTAKHVHTALGDEVTLTAGDTLGLAKGYEMRFFFPDHAACVDISWKVTEKTPDPRPEGGWICLPFNVAAPSFRIGRIGGTIDPAKDIIFGANRNLMCVDRAITVRNGAAGAGVGVASADLPLWSLGKPGLWRYEPDYVPSEPEVFANLYNNQWNTNFPFWIPGSWTVTLRVYPVSEGADEEQAIFTPAWEIRQPCVAAFAEGSQKNIHVEQVGRVKNLNDLHVLHGQNNKGGIAVSRKGVRVTAFCPNPDGAGTVLRVWEQAGKAGEITVTLPKGLKATSAQPVNLRGEPTGEPIAIKNGTFSFVLGAWAPKSFVLSGATMHVFAVTGAEYDFVSAPEAPFKMPDVPVWRVPAREFPITDYGAVTGAVKNTEAFAKAIAACSAAGGGRVVVPEGDWRTGAIHLKSNVALDLCEGSRIVFTDDPADYLPAVHTNWEGVEAMGYSPLIFAYCCTNVAIIGKGRIAPETDLWRTKWDNRNTPMHKAFIATLYDWCSMGIPLEKRDITRFPGSHARPHLIQVNRSANILLEDFLIRGSPFWNIHLFHSENVVVRRVDIYSHGHNTDGIDIDMTKNVIVENCIFDQGDDAVILKAARNHDAWRLGRSTENVVVRNCTVRNGHVLMGAGSDVSGGIRNVLMHDCQMVGNVNNIFFVKTNERRGGFVENIYMKDCSVEMRGKSVPTSVVGIETDVLYEWRNLPTWEVRVTRIRNICAENVRAQRARHLLMVHGDARDPVDGVTLKNVTCGETTQEEIVVVNAKNVTMDGKSIPSCPGKAPAW